jgi:hypothetical protein
MSAMPLPGIFSLLTPLLWVAAMFLLLLAVRSVLQNRSPRKWRDGETIEWGPPRPELAPEPAPSVPANAPADPLKKPPQPMLALFGPTSGAPETKSKKAFTWENKKGIE